MPKFLLLILAVLAIVSGVFYFQRRETLKKKMDELLQKSKFQMSTKLAEPTPFIPVKSGADLDIDIQTTTPIPTVTATPTPLPTVAEDTTEQNKTKGGVAKTTKTRTELVCTPVYGMANSCAEHVVVDTGLETGAFLNLAGLSYLGGLFAFIKAKKRA